MGYAFLQVASVNLDPGLPTQVLFDLTAALFVADKASRAQPFSVQSGDKGAFRTITFIPTCDGVLTTFTCNLESSADGGTTWSVAPGGTAMTFSALAQVQINFVIGGLMYRLNPHTLTFGTGGTKVNVSAVVS